MDHSSTTATVQQQQQLGEKLIAGQPVSPSSSSSTSTSPVPAIKLQRKCSSGWTFSSNHNNNSVTKLRRGGRVKVKLRSWMAEPLAVKEGDASLRLATDLPRFNWLELKLNQKQDGPNGESNGRSPSTTNDSLPIVPLKIRILEKTSYAARLAEGLSIVQPPVQQQDHAVAQHVKTEETSEPACTSRWPLKKRLIRQENQVSPTTSPIVSPVNSPVNLKTISTTLEGSVQHHAKSVPDGMQTDVRLSPPAQRGPVIMRNILPPTPPASSAPPEIMATDADQDKPLDLSKRCGLESPTATIEFRPPAQKREDKAEVEIIAMTTRINQPIRPSDVGFQPLRQRFAHNPAEIRRIQRNDKEVIAKPPLREYTIQRIPSIRPPEPSFPDWNRNVTSGFRPYSGQRPSVGGAVPAAVAPIAPTNRPFVLPPLRPLPHHWNSLVAQQQRNVVIRPEVQLHPVGQAQPSNSFVSGPRLFHPQQVTAATTKKPLSTASHSMTTLPPDWSLRSCVVCSRRADFRCAGCHGNAYCSTLCQVLRKCRPCALDLSRLITFNDLRYCIQY